MIRRQARETVLQVLFQLDLSNETEPNAALERWAAEFSLPEPSLEFARELLLGTIAYKEGIDAVLSRLTAGWSLERMANVDRNILRLAAFEILQRPDIPGRVSVNEAIELAKRFSGEESAKFVNGILDKLLAESSKGTKERQPAAGEGQTTFSSRNGKHKQSKGKILPMKKNSIGNSQGAEEQKDEE